MRRFNHGHTVSEDLLEFLAVVFVDVSSKRPDKSKTNVVHNRLFRVVAFVFVVQRNGFLVKENLDQVQSGLNQVAVLRWDALLTVLSELWKDVFDSCH